MDPVAKTLKKIRACRACERHLPLGVNPVLSAHGDATVLIAGQAPGRKVHSTGTPWDDVSGDRLRRWLGIDRDDFYDETKVALIPMGFCYPGPGKSGENPPRKICRRLWHPKLLPQLKKLRLTVVIGRYAHDYYLADRQRDSLTATVRAWREYSPDFFPLPHPSPRNKAWLKRNPWFESELLPALRRAIRRALA